MEPREKKFVSKAKNRQQKAAKFKQFIGNKSEGQGFADKRKKKIQYEYKKLLQKEHKAAAAKSRSSTSSANDDAPPSPYKGKKHFRQPSRGQVQVKGKNAFSKAAEERQMKMDLKQQKRKEAEERRKAQTEARQAYQQRKKDNFKKICKRTHKGQPVMKNQIEHLLQKIERQVNQT